MRISGGSSDVCSSDLLLVVTTAHTEHRAQTALGDLRVGGTRGDGNDASITVDLGRRDGGRGAEVTDHGENLVLVDKKVGHGHGLLRFAEIGRASCRERVCQYV